MFSATHHSIDGQETSVLSLAREYDALVAQAYLELSLAYNSACGGVSNITAAMSTLAQCDTLYGRLESEISHGASSLRVKQTAEMVPRLISGTVDPLCPGSANPIEPVSSMPPNQFLSFAEEYDVLTSRLLDLYKSILSSVGSRQPNLLDDMYRGDIIPRWRDTQQKLLSLLASTRESLAQRKAVMVQTEDLLKYSIPLSPANGTRAMEQNIYNLLVMAQPNMGTAGPITRVDARQEAAEMTTQYSHMVAPTMNGSVYEDEGFANIVNFGSDEAMYGNPYEYVYEYCLLRTTLPLAFPLTSVSWHHSNYWKSISLHRA